MNTVIYPGSFNPFHDGHLDVLNKALDAFDHVTIAQMPNPLKGEQLEPLPAYLKEEFGDRVELMVYRGMLVDLAMKLDAKAIVRGIRQGADLEYEKTMQYWNEDLGLIVPTLYIITDRNLVHVSSSALRMLDKLKKELEK